jgi:hypothetical protein
MTQPHPPGWYQDPQRRPLQRYWDGQQWTDQTRSIRDSDEERARRRRNLPYLAVVGVAVVGFIVYMVVSNTSDDPAPADTDSGPSIGALKIQAEVACEMALEQTARDPDSVDYRNVDVTMEGDVFTVAGEVNAANALGGMTGFQPYRCEARYDSVSEQMSPTVIAPA